MGWTKGRLVDKAFGELALAGYVYDIDDNERKDALERLDAMMATWGGPGVGIRIGWKAKIDPGAVLPEDDSGLPDWASEAVFLNLAVALASSYGKNLLKSTTARAKQGFDLLQSVCAAVVPQMQPMGNLPRGAGWKCRERPFVSPPRDRLTTGPDGLLDFDGEVPV